MSILSKTKNIRVVDFNIYKSRNDGAIFIPCRVVHRIIDERGDRILILKRFLDLNIGHLYIDESNHIDMTQAVENVEEFFSVKDIVIRHPMNNAISKENIKIGKLYYSTKFNRSSDLSISIRNTYDISMRNTYNMIDDLFMGARYTHELTYYLTFISLSNGLSNEFREDTYYEL